jgi:hypothetical protein
MADLQAGRPSYDGLSMSDTEVRCSQPRPEAASVAIQLSSHCDERTLARYLQVNSQGFGVPFLSDHIRAFTESFDSKFADAGTRGSATCNAFVPTKGCLKSHTVNRGGLMIVRSVEAAPPEGRPIRRNEQCLTLAATLIEILRAFPQLQGKFQGII